jgi:hypothetical protein
VKGGGERMNLKGKRMLVLALAIIAVGATAAYAAFTVTSNVVHMNMAYSVTLTATPSNSNVALLANVTNGGTLVNGIPVDFYVSISNGPWTFVATVSTGSGAFATGYAGTTYVATSNVGYDFEAIANVP